MLCAMNSSQDSGPLHVARSLDGGGHSSERFSAALRQGRMLRLRRGVYVPTELWMSSHPSQRYRLAIAAQSIRTPDAVFCRESSLAVHGLPLLTVPQKLHLRVRSGGSARTKPQASLTGPVPVGEFIRRARESGVTVADRIGPYALKGFDTARHVPAWRGHHVQKQQLAVPVPGTADDGQFTVEVNTESMPASSVESLTRMSFAEGVVVLDAVLAGGPARSPTAPELLLELAQAEVRSRRGREWLQKLLSFASPLAESPGESLARVRFHQLGFAPPQLQLTLRVDGRTYRLDFCWEAAGAVVEFDGWLKYRQEDRSFNEVHRAEKIREDAIRSTGRAVYRIYWEDLMESRSTRLVKLLTRAGVPRRF